ncbi:MAG: twin-arginine translocation pathway signal protein [Desulfobulbus sp.]|nr:twin-arginine translocation pathway signal protein [Desulfobulbus sp.]
MKTHTNDRCNLITLAAPVIALVLAFAILTLGSPRSLQAATAEELDSEANNALQTLYRTTPAARDMARVAKGILVFPRIVKGGFIFGGQYGEGALRVGGKTTGYYRSIAASYGLQAGAQTFGYALFFLDDASLRYLKDSDGWEIGVGPSIVIMDEGKARSFSTTTAKSGVYAFFFSQHGLMAGLGITGSKISEIYPRP